MQLPQRCRSVAVRIYYGYTIICVIAGAVLFWVAPWLLRLKGAVAMMAGFAMFMLWLTVMLPIPRRLGLEEEILQIQREEQWSKGRRDVGGIVASAVQEQNGGKLRHAERILRRLTRMYPRDARAREELADQIASARTKIERG